MIDSDCILIKVVKYCLYNYVYFDTFYYFVYFHVLFCLQICKLRRRRKPKAHCSSSFFFTVNESVQHILISMIFESLSLDPVQSGRFVYDVFLLISNNSAYPENTNFETFAPRDLKFHIFGDLHTTKKC